VSRLFGLARLSRKSVILAGSAAVDSIGTGLFLALASVFAVLFVGVDPVQVGVVVGLANAIALLAPIPAGWLADRFGAVPVWTVLLLARAIGYGCFLLVSSFGSYMVLLCLLGLFDRASSPVQQVFVLRMEPPENRSRSMATLRTARNIGIGIGLLLAGVVISIGTREAFMIGFLANALSFLVTLVVMRRLARTSDMRASGRDPEEDSDAAARRGVALRDRPYLALTTGNALVLLHDSELFTLLPLWIISKTDLSPAWIGPLLAANTVLTVLLQIPLTRWVHSIPTARTTTIWSLLPLLIAVALFILAEQSGSAAVQLPVVLLAVLLLTLGENLHAVSAFELSYRLASERSFGSYLGVFDFGHATQLAVGPPFVTVVVLRGTIGWVALGAAFALGATLMAAAAVGRTRRLD